MPSKFKVGAVQAPQRQGYKPVPKEATRELHVKIPFTPTPEQVAIMQCVSAEKCNIVVVARAGTGKTTTLQYGALLAPERDRERMHYTVFGRRNKAQGEEKFRGSGVTCATINSTVLQILRLQRGRIDIHDEKHKNKIRDIMYPRCNKDYKVFQSLKELVSQAMQQYLIEPGDTRRQGLLKLADHHGWTTGDAFYKALDMVDTAIDEMARVHKIMTFDESLYIAAKEGLGLIGEGGTLLVDEAQDLNPVQHQLVINTARNGCRVVLIGDPQQAIFGFRGSTSNSIAVLTEKLKEFGEIKEFQLSVTHRCPPEVIDWAQHYCPGITSSKQRGNSDRRTITARELEGVCKPGTMVLCRVNSLLVPYAYDLAAKGKKVCILGRDVVKRLDGIITDISYLGVNNWESAVSQWGDQKRRELLANAREGENVERRLGMINEDENLLYNLVKVKCDGFAEAEKQARMALDWLFTDEPSGDAVVFSSIHKAKGLEAENVVIVGGELLPMRRKFMQPWEVEEERNLTYVALTRSLRNLYPVQDGNRVNFLEEIREAEAEKEEETKEEGLGKTVKSTPEIVVFEEELTLMEMEEELGMTVVKSWLEPPKKGTKKEPRKRTARKQGRKKGDSK